MARSWHWNAEGWAHGCKRDPASDGRGRLRAFWHRCRSSSTGRSWPVSSGRCSVAERSLAGAAADENRARGLADDALCRGAEQRVAQRTAAVARDHDQIDLLFGRDPNDLRGRFALRDALVDLAPGAAGL